MKLGLGLPLTINKVLEMALPDSYAYPHISQTTSSKTRDAAWQRANLFGSIYGGESARRAIIGLSDPYTLEVNNQFGNTLRFTSPTGEALAEPIISGTEFYDNYTGLWYRFSSFGSDIWSDAMDTVAAFDDGSWYLAPLEMQYSLVEVESVGTYFINKFIDLTATRTWTSTSQSPAVALNAIVAGAAPQGGIFTARAKSSATAYNLIYKLIP